MTDTQNCPTVDPNPRSLAMLVWDAPNVDMELARIIGARPSRDQRPEAGALGQWLLATTSGEVSATVFLNVTSDEDLESKRGWMHFLMDSGFDVFPKPKYTEADDVDEAMVDAINKRRSTLARLVLMSHDRERFAPLAEELVAEGVEVTPLVLRDLNRWPDGCTPIHLYDLPGVVKEKAPRLLDFDSLPREGVLLESPRPLSQRRRPGGPNGSGTSGPATLRAKFPVGELSQLTPIVREVLHGVVESEPAPLTALGKHIHRAFDEVGVRTDEKVSVLIAAAIEGEPFVIDLDDDRPLVRRVAA